MEGYFVSAGRKFGKRERDGCRQGLGGNNEFMNCRLISLDVKHAGVKIIYSAWAS